MFMMLLSVLFDEFVVWFTDVILRNYFDTVESFRLAVL